MVALTAWLVAQSLKVLLEYLTSQRLSLVRFVGAGGMPSSHTAFMMALSTSVGLTEGWGSNMYAIALAITLVVMYDATGVRRATGKQAKLINELVDEIFYQGELKQEKLKELIGHTPFEVIAGALLGIGISLLFFSISS